MCLDAQHDFYVGPVMFNDCGQWGLIPGDILVYDELSESFVNRLLSLSDVSNATAILTNQAPVWDGTEYS